MKAPSTLTPLFALIALLGLAAHVSFWGMFATVRLADIEVRHALDPEPGGMPESWFWVWTAAGWLGLIVFLFFGALAFTASRLTRAQTSRSGTAGKKRG